MASRFSRRSILKFAGASLFIPGSLLAADSPRLITKAIPSSNEQIPVIGMGTWRTFNVGSDLKLQLARTEVLRTFFKLGGGVVDCSPMYGSSASVLGFALNQLKHPDSLFSADKVWTRDSAATRDEVQYQADRWNIDRFDLMQVHNLLNWQDHLPVLQEMKRQGQLRYVGITTSHGRRHDELVRIMMREQLDFVQLTYNLTNREAERRLLPVAQERGIAIIANRPYDGGYLIDRLKKRAAVPEWAKAELGCRTWADYLLKFVVSHPAITCAIPATTQVAHMQENMIAGYDFLPDGRQRLSMTREIESL